MTPFLNLLYSDRGLHKPSKHRIQAEYDLRKYCYEHLNSGTYEITYRKSDTSGDRGVTVTGLEEHGRFEGMM
jgi:hypothetical protein